MLKYLYPHIPLADLRPLACFTLLGALLAGCYGILHDQITFTIGPQYYYNFKFEQFAYADLGFGDRIFAGCIGFLATWWVGLIIGWILARRAFSNPERKTAYRQIGYGFLIVFATTFTAGVLAYLYGLWRGPEADYSAWQPTLAQLHVSDTWGFMRVAYIHNAGYLGGLLGLVLAFLLIKPATAPPS